MVKLFKNINNLVTCRNKGRLPKKGKAQSDIGLVKNGYILEDDGIIKFSGDEKKFNDFRKRESLEIYQEIDCSGKTILPGFIDSHTHFVFAGSRSNEYEMRISGKSYEDIRKKGGGIQSTVNAVRRASEEELIQKAEKHLKSFAAYGTTTLEGKSGYGLDFKNEVKLLKTIKKLSQRNKNNLDILPTFLGAHSIPVGIKKSEYIDTILYEMIPYVAKEKLAFFIDVFCEKNYFSAEDTARIINQGKNFGLVPKIHTDQFNSIGGIETAVKYNALSVDHLEVLKTKDIKLLSGRNIIATLLPGASYFLDISYPPARELISMNVPTAIATDFNPGSCMSENLQIMMSFASVKMKMSAEEIINAVTINAAHSLFLQKRAGSIEKGKQADFIIFDFPGYKDLIYHFGVNQINAVYKKGKKLNVSR